MSDDIFVPCVMILLVGVAGLCGVLTAISYNGMKKAFADCDRALAGWRNSLEKWKNNAEQSDAYEAALRRELATLRARKRYKSIWPYSDDLLRLSWYEPGFGKNKSEFMYTQSVHQNIARWRKDRTEGNWGKYLRREKEIKQR